MVRLCLILLLTALLLGCGSTPPPRDANGHSPEDVMLATYTAILENRYDEALSNFSAEYIE